jgi:uncharacterized protein (TIGR02466 family)
MKIPLFATEIYKTRFENVDKLSQLCQSKVITDRLTDRQGGQEYLLNEHTKNSFLNWKDHDKQIHEEEDFREVIDFIEKHGKIYWDSLGYYPSVVPKVYQSWTVLYEEGGRVASHSHAPEVLVGVLYMNASPDQGNIVFENPMDVLLSTQPYVRSQYENRFNQEVEVNTGDLILFPGYLKHYTIPNATDKNRVVLAINFNTTGNSTSIWGQ